MIKFNNIIRDRLNEIPELHKNVAVVIEEDPSDLRIYVRSDKFDKISLYEIYDSIHSYFLENDDLEFEKYNRIDLIITNESGTEEVEEFDLINSLRIWEEGYDDESLGGYTIVRWPEVQDYMDKPGFYLESYLINDELGYETFGDSAYVIPNYMFELWKNY